jgi:hypothetical protein
LKFKTIHEYQVEVACCLLVERGISVVGMTLGDVLDKALEFGLLKAKPGRGFNFKDLDEDLPREFVIPDTPAGEEEGEDIVASEEHDWDD